jgi:hypothetical protein
MESCGTMETVTLISHVGVVPQSDLGRLEQRHRPRPRHQWILQEDQVQELLK